MERQKTLSAALATLLFVAVIAYGAESGPSVQLVPVPYNPFPEDSIPAVSERHPDWQRILSDPDFQQWLNHRFPDHDLPAKDLLRNFKINEAILVLDEYKASRKARTL